MKDKILEIAKRHPCKLGFLVQTLNGETIAEHNPDVVFQSASTIKLFILWAVYKKISDGLLSENDLIDVSSTPVVGGCGLLQHMNTKDLKLSVRDVSSFMIDLSDNVATNLLINLAGIDYINAEIKKYDCKATVLARYLMDTAAKARGLDNFTSPRDTMRVLRNILFCEDIKKPLRDTMHNMLKAQILNDHAALRLPLNYVYAHKTGNLAATLHDAGVLHTPNNSYYVTVMMDEIPDIIEGKRLQNDIGECIFKEISKLEAK